MPEQYDVFLSHSSKDKSIVHPLAERLKADGLRVWLDAWEIKPGDNIPVKLEEGLENSRVLILCMSANAFGSDWATLESQTFRFRDPLNKDRRFIPLRLDDAAPKGMLAQFSYVDWRGLPRDPEYRKLLDACGRDDAKKLSVQEENRDRQVEKVLFSLGHTSPIETVAWSPDGGHALSGSHDNTVRVWDVESGRCLRVLEGHTDSVWSVSWSPDGGHALSGSHDNTVRVWDVESGRCLRTLEGHTNTVWGVAWSPDGRHALSGSGDKTVRVWEVEWGRCLRVLEGHTGSVQSVAWSPDGRRALSGSVDTTMRLWDLKTDQCLRVLEGNPDIVYGVSFGPDGRHALSGSRDNAVRLWEVESGRCLQTLQGHSSYVQSVAFSPNGRYALSGANDKTVRLWEVESGRCLRVLEGHANYVRSVAWSPDGRHALSGSIDMTVRLWEVESGRGLAVFEGHPGNARSAAGKPSGPHEISGSSNDVMRVWPITDAVATRTSDASTIGPVPREGLLYTNAKVLLVGESGAGKTGLSKRLASNNWEPTDSTVGAWATQWKLPVTSTDGVEREIWLWDFGGQADQRLIHSLFMNETSLAVLVFDGQKEDLFETLGQWDRDLTRAARKDFGKLLVAGRVDAGGLRAARGDIDKFVAERKFHSFLETSAKKNVGCEELKQAILKAINWDEIPCRTTQVLFKRLKDEIIRLKDEGRVLLRFNELREALQLRLTTQPKRFTDEELAAVLTLLAGPGVVWELAFGSFVLLQPECINAYAQGVIRTLQADEHQRGCLMEERVLKGELTYESSMKRLEGDEERFVLLAMHQTLVERGLCFRQPTDKGNLLVFPSYYRRERPEAVKFPAVLVNYRFTGFLDEIYATLVVRLHHTAAFEQDQLWRYAADFKTNTGKQLGVKLTRRAPGIGDLEVYFDAAIPVEEKIIFSKYVHEHLRQYAQDVERFRHYICPHCGAAVGNRDVAMTRLNAWLHDQPPDFKAQNSKDAPTIICVGCEKRVPLWDDMERCFASPEVQQRVRDMQEESQVVLDNESKERALVGDVISTVALAAQISREFSVSDHGIDMEIEFKSDAHEATGAKLYLQLKSGDSYLRRRERDDVEIFTIKDERHARYWMAQQFPVMLVIRNAEGEVRWMEVRNWLKRETDNGKKPIKHIVFEGERLDVMSVRRWRDRLLSNTSPTTDPTPEIVVPPTTRSRRTRKLK